SDAGSARLHVTMIRATAIRPTAILLKLFAAATIALAQQAPSERPASVSPTRTRELTQLLQSRDPEAPAKIRKMLSDSDWYVRGEAARALGFFGNKSDAELVLPLASEENWFVKTSALGAVSALGAAPDPATVERLLTSTDPFTRAQAAYALGKLNYAPSVNS